MKSGERISKQEIERFLLDNKDQGFDIINLHGGEPTLRRDLFSILGFIRQIGYSAVSIQTNGWTLANPEFASRLVHAGVTQFIISVHGHHPELHDHISGAQGSFTRIFQGMQNIVRLGQAIKTNTVITRLNYDRLSEIAERVTGGGAFQVNFSSLMATGRAFTADKELTVSFAEVEPYVRKAIETVRQRGASASLEGFPQCVIRGHENLCVQRELSDEEQVKCLIRGAVWSNHDDMVANNLKAKQAECSGCLYSKKCGGVYKSYIQTHGWSEFQPVQSVREDN